MKIRVARHNFDSKYAEMAHHAVSEVTVPNGSEVFYSIEHQTLMIKHDGKPLASFSEVLEWAITPRAKVVQLIPAPEESAQ